MAARDAAEDQHADEAKHTQEQVTLPHYPEALKKSGELLLQAVLDASEGIIFAKDLKGRYILANPAFSRLFNRPVEDIIGKKDEELFSKEEAELLRARDSIVLETGKPLSSADRLTIGGKERVFVSTKVPLRNEAGKIIGLSGFATEITDEIQVRDKIAHLNQTLRAIRTVNQLITKEKNRDRLLQGTCGLLVKTRGYNSAWITLLDDHKNLVAFYHAGLGNEAKPLNRMLKGGELPECVRRALEKPSVVMIEEPATACNNCPLLGKSPEHRELTARLEYRGKVYGLVSVSLPQEYASIEEEQAILYELAEDLAFALHDIEVEEERQRAQEALRESEAHYRSIVENSHAGILVVDDAYRFIYVNDELCRILGRRREEIIGHDFREFLDDESRDLVTDRYRRRQRGETVPSRYEFNVIRKDGEKRRVESSSTVIRNSTGQVKTIAQLLDITERVQAEEKLKESEEKYRSLIEDVLDSSSVGIFILDSDFKVIWINRALERYFGLRREEVIGVDKRELIRNQIKDIFEDPTGFAEKILTTYENNTYIEHFECHVLPGTNREERWLNHWSQPIRSGRYAGGRVEHYTDITDRKKLETSLKDSEERIRLLIDTSPDAIFSADLNGRFTSANRVMMERLGYSQDELLTMNIRDVIAPEYVSLLTARIKRVLAGEALHEPGEYEVIGKNGQRFWIAVNSAPLYKNDEIIGFLGIARDVTEKVNLQRRLSAIHALGRKFILFQDEKKIAQAVVEAAREVLGMEDCSLYLVDDDKKRLYLQACLRNLPNELRELSLDSNTGIIAAAARAGETIYIPDVSQDPRYLPGKAGSQSEVCVPLKVRGRVIGVLNTESPTRDAFSISDRRLLETLADTAAVALENARLFNSLRCSEEQFRSVAESAADAIIIGDDEGKIVFWNKAAQDIFGYTAEEVVGRSIAILIPKRFRDAFTNRMERQRQTGKLITSKKRVTRPGLRKDGSEFPAEISYAGWKVGDKNFSAAVIRDITERLTAEEVLRESYERLQRTMEGIIEALEAAIELRDPYTAGHQLRVAKLAVAIAEEMGIPAEQISGLRYACLVHDIGKLAVPAEILSKPSSLTDTEFALIKLHPQQAYDILKEIDFPWPVADIVLQHHERLDGSGYPQGLKGEEIMLEARILAVADIVEAISSHRPYRPALGTEVALAEIKEKRGKLYDPNVVDACIAVFEKGFLFT